MQLPPWQRPGMAWHSSTSTGRRAKMLESAAIATDECSILAWREHYEKEEALLQVGGFTFHNAITHQITLEIRWRTEKGHKGIAGLSTQARGRQKYSNIFQSKHRCVYALVVCSRLVGSWVGEENWFAGTSSCSLQRATPTAEQRREPMDCKVLLFSPVPGRLILQSWPPHWWGDTVLAKSPQEGLSTCCYNQHAHVLQILFIL